MPWGSWEGGVPISHNALQHFPECHGAAGGGGTLPGPAGGGGYPGQVHQVGQQKEYSLHGGRYASCVHAGGLYCSKFILQFSMSNLSATSIASAVLITVALIASILSLAIDRWGQFSITVELAKTDVRAIVVSYYTLFTRFLCISKTARVSSAPDTGIRVLLLMSCPSGDVYIWKSKNYTQKICK